MLTQSVQHSQSYTLAFPSRTLHVDRSPILESRAPSRTCRPKLELSTIQGTCELHLDLLQVATHLNELREHISLSVILGTLGHYGTGVAALSVEVGVEEGEENR